MGNSHSTRLNCLEDLCDICAKIYRLSKKKRDGHYAEDPLQAAGERGHTECLRKMIAAGMDVNASNHCTTALTIAVRYDHDDCVKTLLEVGAIVNVPHTRGDSPIEKAVQRGIAKCVTMLIEAGTDVNRRSLTNTSALTVAAESGYYDCMELLIKAGADVNISDPNGKGLLTIVVSKCTSRDAKLLINAGVNVNAVDADKRGRNALCSHIYKCAYRNKSPDRIIILLLCTAGETLDGILFADVSFDILNCLDQMDISLADILQREHQSQQAESRYRDYMLYYSENHQICLKAICRVKAAKVPSYVVRKNILLSTFS